MRLAVLDSLSDPAKPGGENEDRIGWNATAAFVIDGATSLGDPVIDPPHSDAAWLADLARRQFETEFRPDRPSADVVRALNTLAREGFHRAGGEDVERWRQPNAGFQALRIVDGAIETAGLADCVLFLRDADGAITRHSGFRGSRGHEQGRARQVVARLGGLGPDGESHRDAETLEALRRARSRLNTPESIWTLGIHPEAADHLLVTRLDVRLPATGLLCSDGFADLVDNYGAYTAEDLIQAARTEGLANQLRALRRIERAEDPEALRFPRFKRCDDASAILVDISMQ